LEELKKIFASGNLPKNGYPEQFWAPLLALFTGSRISEICQLHRIGIGKRDLGYCDFVGVELDRTLAMTTVVQIEFGSIIHNIHFNKFEVFNANCITEYTNNKTLLYKVVSNELKYRRVRSEQLEKAD